MPRPKAYEPDAALQSAMQLFWTDGFEITSIPKLEKRLGINRFSIYDAFGSKRKLFLKALESYTGMLIDTLVEPLESGTDGLGDLERFLSRFQRLFLGQKAPRGCLLCNTATELGNRDEEIALKVNAYFERVETAVFKCLLRAQDLGELDGGRDMLRDRARVARSCMQGVLIDLRLGRRASEIRRALGALKSYILGNG